MDKHADNGARAWQDVETAAGGRYLDGQQCPPVAPLFRLAASQARTEPTTAEGQHLLTHLKVCAVCRRTFRAARAAAERGPVTEGPSRLLRQAIREAYPDADASMPPGSLLEELADAARVPVLWRCARGCIRCVVGRRGLLLLIDPVERDGDWGKVYTLRCGEGFIQGTPADAAGGLLTWGAEQPVELCLMPDDAVGMWRLDRVSWGEGLRFVAVAPYPGSPDAAESSLNDFELRYDEETRVQVMSPRDRGPTLVGHAQGGGLTVEQIVEGLRNGSELIARKSLRQFANLATPPLYDILAAWPEVHAEPLWIEQALADTFTKVWDFRSQLPADPSHWLLTTAGTILYQIAQHRCAAAPLPPPVQHPVASAPVTPAQPVTPVPAGLDLRIRLEKLVMDSTEFSMLFTQ